MERVALVSGVRTPIGRYGGSLKDVEVSTLGALVLSAALDKIGLDPAAVGEVVAAQAYQNGECANAGRVSLLEAGWPDTVSALTLDRRCCSGVDALWIAAMKIQTGNAEVAVALGLDSMSRAEMYLPGEIKWGLGGKKDPKWGFMPRGHGAMAMWGVPFFDRIQRARVMSQPIARYGELNSMMAWAETAAKMEGITREAADAWSARSHAKAVAAMEAGIFAEELVPVPLPPSKKGPASLDADETPRPGTTAEKLAKLPTVYPDGVCTAGNSSSENDGAAAIVLMSEAKVKELGLTPLAWFEAAAVGACDPTITYPAVDVAVRGALAKAGLELGDIELFEIQEAFAVQMLADAKLMGVPQEDYETKINVNGSGISLGHPIGATGVMRTVTLLHQMQRQDAKKGLVTICGGGGQGIAAVFSR
ncbi:MAG: thiolase family protein [Desulfarculaceae bacterium]|nr:thiolase family protein [Desulfarculaceae bacterium]